MCIRDRGSRARGQAEACGPWVARDEIVCAAALVEVEALGDGGGEPARELEREGEALARVLGQTEGEDAIDVGGELREGGWPRGDGVDDVVEGGRDVLAGEDRMAGDGAIDDRGEGVDVGAMVHVFAAGLLGCHVCGCAYDVALGQGARAAGLRDAEVEDLPAAEPAFLGEEHVVGLEIAMDDAGDARGFEADRDLVDKDLGLGKLEAALAAQLVGEVVAAQALHREERDGACGGANLEDANDVGAVEARGGLGLAQEALEMDRLGEDARVEELDGTLAAIGGGVGLVDLAHAAAADDHAEAERADDLVGEAARAADLEDAIEVGAGLGEQGVAVGVAADGLLELGHRVEGDALADAGGEVGDEVERLDDAEDRDLLAGVEVIDADDPVIGEQARDDAEAEDAVDDRDEGVEGGGDAAVGAEAEEVDAVDEHGGDRRAGAPVVDAGHGAEDDRQAGEEELALIVARDIAQHDEDDEGADGRADRADEDDELGDGVAAGAESDDDAARAQ